MRVQAFLGVIFSNILRIEYFFLPSLFDNCLSSTLQHYIHNHDIPQQDYQINSNNNETIIALDWMIHHMGTKRNYPNNYSDMYSQDNITTEYTIEQMQLIIRHGTRYPVSSGMDAINKLLSTLQQSNNASKNDPLIGWIPTYQNEYLYRRTGHLDLNGQQEVYLIGKRLALKYPELISSLIDKDIITDNFQASSSWASRTSQTAQALSIGLFEHLGTLGSSHLMSVPIFTLSKNNDSLIAMQKACPKWQRYAKKRTSVMLEPVIERMVRPIATKINDLGFEMTVQDVMGLHGACTAEVALHKTVDTFCKLLTRQDVLHLEYIDDLNHYYKYAHGLSDLNDNMACDLVKNILSNIKQAVTAQLQQQQEGKTAVKLDIKVGHSETMLPLRSFLGLYRDETGLGLNSTQQEIDNRQYRLSNFGYFANNMAFQLLSHKESRRLFVRVLDNEVPIVMPGCIDVLCPIDQFQEYMKARTRCNFAEFCKVV